MKTNDNFTGVASKVASSDSDIFSDLVEISGLNPATDFRGARLNGVDLGESHLESFNFDLADLRGANWRGLLTEPSSTTHCLRGNGEDNVSGADFPQLSAVCVSRENWGERFLAFKLIIDNWGENTETADLLVNILKTDKGTYLRLCTFIYFCASYARDEKMMNRCIEMAKAGRSQTNMFRLKTLRKAVRDYSKYFESVNFEKRYPGDIDRVHFTRIQYAMDTVEDREPDRRFI
ncbi:pentapeptide repeat-containing protein [Pseudooceanicola sp.]|uniref:pentapeptide repeat-containing protein n=1 Tax=Pseudooceanicola sp. TaxID=1914328 RepID=UPI0035C6D472